MDQRLQQPPKKASSLLQALGGRKPTIAKRTHKKAHASNFVISSDRTMKTRSHDGDSTKQTYTQKKALPLHPQPGRMSPQTHVERLHDERGIVKNDIDDHAMIEDPMVDEDCYQDRHLDLVSPMGYSSNQQSTHRDRAVHHQDLEQGYEEPSKTSRSSRTVTRTHIQIVSDNRQTESMEGVEDHGIKPPLVVLDGANVAHAYGKTLSSAEADARGIRVACHYFIRAQLRVLVVLPAHWFQRKVNSNRRASTCDDEELMRIVHELDSWGVLVPAPPTDDDDAYVLTIARRESVRARQSQLHCGGYVLSNDLFRDAQSRDPTGELKTWLTQGISHVGQDSSSLAVAAASERGPGRISFTFCDMRRMNDRGEHELDFIPNPRHPLVSWIENSGFVH